MAYDYDMTALIRNSTRYIRKKVTADSFREAFHVMLSEDKALYSSVMDIYCRKKNGDFQYMGLYDGKSAVAEGGEYRIHLLKTADGNTYTLGDDGFVSRE